MTDYEMKLIELVAEITAAGGNPVRVLKDIEDIGDLLNMMTKNNIHFVYKYDDDSTYTVNELRREP